MSRSVVATLGFWGVTAFFIHPYDIQWEQKPLVWLMVDEQNQNKAPVEGAEGRVQEALCNDIVEIHHPWICRLYIF